MSSSKYRDTCPLDCKVYVGDLGSNASRQELEDIFGYYGPLRNVWVARNPPGFAFVEFEDARDADDSVRALDGRKICGRSVRVEMSSGQSRSRSRAPPPPRRSTMRPDERCYECGDRGHYARDCTRSGRRGGGGGRRRSRSRSRSRSPRARRGNYSRSRSRSASRSRSKSPKRSRTASPVTRNSRSRSRSRDRKDRVNGQINDGD